MPNVFVSAAITVEEEKKHEVTVTQPKTEEVKKSPRPEEVQYTSAADSWIAQFNP